MFCGAIKKDLSVATCPLRQGDCYWQHAKTNKCKYTVEEITVDQFCERTGRTLPPDDVREELIADIKATVKP
jgi:hypothetical protein